MFRRAYLLWGGTFVSAVIAYLMLHSIRYAFGVAAIVWIIGLLLVVQLGVHPLTVSQRLMIVASAVPMLALAVWLLFLA